MGKDDDMITWCPQAPPPMGPVPKMLVYCPHRKLISQKQKIIKLNALLNYPLNCSVWKFNKI